MKISSIKQIEPFNELFPIENNILNAVKTNMEQYGFDHSFPILVWQRKNICIDGHTRLMAAEVLGIKDVPVHKIDFTSEDEALEYAIHVQRDRRNMTDADFMRCIEFLDKRKKLGAPKGNKNASKTTTQSCAVEPKRSSQEVAVKLGTSARKVEQARTIADHADDETKADVKAGKKSINKAYNETQKERKKPKSNAQTPEDLKISSEFEKAFDSMVSVIQNAKKDKWQHTTKAAALDRVQKLKNEIR